MRIFLTIAISLLWLNSFSQEKTIVVKKETPELTISGAIKNNGNLSKQLLNNNLKLKIINSNYRVVSYEIVMPTLDGKILVKKKIDDSLDKETREHINNLPIGSFISIMNVIALDGKEEVRIPGITIKVSK
jgi:hypothetical protein